MSEKATLEKITNLCKRRGLIFQSSEIYGGINGFWDFGPYGVAMRRSLEQLWWNYMVESRDNVEGQDSTIICHPRVWDASGHTEQFADYMVDHKITKKRYRLDNLLEQQEASVLEAIAAKLGKEADAEILEIALVEIAAEAPAIMAECGVIDPSDKKKKGDWTEPRQFNLMMQTYVGPVFDEDHKAYLRAETCQPIFINFNQIQTAARQKLPFGIAQTGKAFRNEINPRNFIFRSREFTQMEMEFFCHADEAMDWYNYWRDERYKFYTEVLGFEADVLRTHDHEKLAHYAQAAQDFEFKFPFGWGELEGVHHRGEWDLSRHAEYSGQKLKYFDQERGEHYYPTVIETSVGLDRLMLAILCNAYDEDEASTQKEGKAKDIRTVLRLPSVLAPVQVAILPLSKKLSEDSEKIYADLRKGFRAEHDSAGQIGKRYRRFDEIGTPFCVTVDFETAETGMVTVRERDTMEQEKVALTDLKAYIFTKLN